MPSLRRKQAGLERSEGHIPVTWLDAQLPPTRWDKLDRRWINLPAALLIALVVFAAVVPAPSIPTPSVTLPSLGFAGLDDDETPESRLAAVDTVDPAGTPDATPAAAAARAAFDPAVAATSGAAVPGLAAISQAQPNELGGVPVIMYHAFVADPANTDEWTLTFDQFREQLDWFRENDFVMVGMQSMIDGRFDVPAGKKPIILTFDDSNSTQFGLQEAAGGGYEVRPDTAVGVLEEYREEYPDFAGPAFFAILTWNCFGSDNDPSSCEDRLTWLVEHGYEVGNHTADHVELTDVAPEFFTESIASMILWLNERVPAGPGNLSHVVVMPFGAFPDPDLHADQRSWLYDGFWYLGEPVNLDLVIGVNGGPAISPYSLEFYRAHIYRIASEPGILEYWQDAITSGEAQVFVSDGDADVVTVPASQQDMVDPAVLEARGLELRVYDDAAA